MPAPEMQSTRGYEGTALATLSTSGQILSGYEQAKAVYFYASADLCEVESIRESLIGCLLTPGMLATCWRNR